MAKVINNWFEKIKRTSEIEEDSRFQSWVKYVTSVDPNQKGGYMFEGPFVKNGTIELDIKPSVFLVMITKGSRKYQTSHYTIVLMDKDGNLSLPDQEIATTSDSPGWALRIRDRVTAVVAAQNQ